MINKKRNLKRRQMYLRDGQLNKQYFIVNYASGKLDVNVIGIVSIKDTWVDIQYYINGFPAGIHTQDKSDPIFEYKKDAILYLRKLKKKIKDKESRIPKKKRFEILLILNGFKHKITSFREFNSIENFADYLKSEFDLIINHINKE